MVDMSTQHKSSLPEQGVRAVAAESMGSPRDRDLPIAPEYLTEAQVAQLTGFSPRALEAMRSRREGPAYLKIGRSVRYRAADVRAWIEGAAP